MIPAVRGGITTDGTPNILDLGAILCKYPAVHEVINFHKKKTFHPDGLPRPHKL